MSNAREFRVRRSDKNERFTTIYQNICFRFKHARRNSKNVHVQIRKFVKEQNFVRSECLSAIGLKTLSNSRMKLCAKTNFFYSKLNLLNFAQGLKYLFHERGGVCVQSDNVAFAFIGLNKSLKIKSIWSSKGPRI